MREYHPFSNNPTITLAANSVNSTEAISDGIFRYSSVSSPKAMEMFTPARNLAPEVAGFRYIH